MREQLRQIFRRLGRTPTFTAITLLTLAVGIGANAAIFTVIDGVLLKPMPYPRAEQVVSLANQTQFGLLKMTPSDYFIDREQSQVFQDVGVYSTDSVSVTGPGEPEQVASINVTDGILPILGIPPMLGRVFNRADDTPQSPETVVLTYGYWQRKFGGDANAIGRTITLDGTPHEIIGVMPRGFRFVDVSDVSLFVPRRFDRAKVVLGNYSHRGIARLKPGVTLAQAQADRQRLIPVAFSSFPPPPGFDMKLFEKIQVHAVVTPLKKAVVGDIEKLLWVLTGSIGIVLLIACANVANLLLVRAEGRQQELTIRAALGASRGRIARELLLESFVLGLLGSVLGLGLAYGATRLLIAMAPAGLPRLEEISMNVPVLLFTLGISLFASLLFGSLPVLKYAGAHAGTGLREGGRTLSAGRSRLRVRNLLVVAQVGLAFVLLICAGLMIRTFRALTQVDPGFAAPDQVQTFRVGIPETHVKDPDATIRMFEAMLHKVEAIPGVTSAGIASSVPMDGEQWFDPVFVQDHPLPENEIPTMRRFKFASPTYFQTAGIWLIAGRAYTWDDNYGRREVAIVSENFAREFWGNPANALGKQIRVGQSDDWRQIVGVVGNVFDDGTSEPAPSDMYWPLLMNKFEGRPEELRRDVAFAIRTPRAGTASLMRDARDAVWSVDANVPVATVRTLGDYYRESMARTSFTLVMLGIAGAMALLLGTIGLYGVIAYSVSQRTREIGIRMALGAQRKELTKMFVRQGMWLAAAGVVCGVAVAIAAVRLLAAQLFQVSPADPVTYAAVSVGLVGVAAIASYVPSRRAANVDPVEALRAE